MIRYAIILNDKTGECSVGLGTDEDYYKTIGMEEMDVEQSDVDNGWYLKSKCPHLTPEEIAQRERERLDQLSLTKREVFLALYRDKGITPEIIIGI